MDRRSVVKAIVGLPLVNFLPKLPSEPAAAHSMFESFEERHFAVGDEKWTMIMYGFGINFVRASRSQNET